MGIPQKEKIYIYKGDESRVTCAPYDDKASRCVFEEGKCNDNPLYANRSQTGAENVEKCQENICVDKVWWDKDGDSCAKYEDGQYCDDNGKEGPGWPDKLGDGKGKK